MPRVPPTAEKYIREVARIPEAKPRVEARILFVCLNREPDIPSVAEGKIDVSLTKEPALPKVPDRDLLVWRTKFPEENPRVAARA
jgi:hypothetical protein